ncbi:ABC transporter substrate-binding protein [Cystobacter fuscus]|uniref:substrate-binding domain-containing protein n=1 Tax=Cystobacter fuscus TaxID=43 RepID=UPI002B286A43|nr:ABC transporter substrate-binding protein [Cystobacter fuscus]
MRARAGAAVRAPRATSANRPPCHRQGRGTPTRARDSGEALPSSRAPNHGTEKHAWLQAATQAFHEKHPLIRVTLEEAGSLESLEALLSGERRPTIWSPASQDMLRLLEHKWREPTGAAEAPLIEKHESVVMTPLVIVKWRSNQRWSSKDAFSWDALRGHLPERSCHPRHPDSILGGPAWSLISACLLTYRHSGPSGSVIWIIMLTRTKIQAVFHSMMRNWMYSTLGLPPTTIRGMMTQHIGGFAVESSN